MSEQRKVTKSEADYKVGPDKGGCRVCQWLETDEGNDCDVVDATVSPKGGCCNYWQKEHPPMGVGKEAAVYVEVKPSVPGYPPVFLCGDCRFFQKPRACSRVIGLIRAVDACKLWEAAATVGEKQMAIANA